MGVMGVFKKKTKEERLEELEKKRKKEEGNIEDYNALENKWWPCIRQNTLFHMRPGQHPHHRTAISSSSDQTQSICSVSERKVGTKCPMPPDSPHRDWNEYIHICKISILPSTPQYM